ncbi:hypothetical protein FXE42_06580 [Vibrio cholerae]|uniref:TcfC E-set like domain-containing protein n=1 Tax=Vibrio cholerae TaxID=666 RepID=UPI0011D7EA01|nr:TcfC E-set like domain-containing protein [Vibrio cholerae]TXZ90953.1 hypothetical protein FXE42_06580 [Vibrio cholerae]
MFKFNKLALIFFFSPSLMASNFTMPAGFEYLLEHGVEIDVLFNSDKENSDLRRIARIRNIDDAYQIKYFTQDFMAGVKPHMKDTLQTIFTNGLPEKGIYCQDAEKYQISLQCSPEELLLKMKYDPKKLLGTLYIAPQFLELDIEENKSNPLYLGQSSTSDSLTSVVNYELFTSKDDEVLRNHLSLNSVISKGDKNFNLGGYMIANNQNKDSDSSNSQVTTSLTQAAWSQNSQGYEKTVGLLKGHTLSSSVFGSSNDIVGVAYGSSNATKLRVSRQSDIDVVVLVPSDGRIESYRDGRLINTQFLPQGVQNLDTRSFPGGIYEVELKVYQDQQLFSTQKSYIYKSAVLEDQEFKFWAGSMFKKNKVTDHWVVGGFYADKLSPSAQYNFKSELTDELLASELSLTQDLGVGNLRTGVSLDTKGKKNANASLGLRYGSVSTNHRLSWSDNGQEMYSTSHTAFWRYSSETDFNLNLTKRWYKENDYSLSFGINHKLQNNWTKDWFLQSDFTHTDRENYWGLNLQIPLTSSIRTYAKHTSRGANSAGLSYYYNDRESLVNSANLSVDQTFGDENYSAARGSAFFEGQYADGSVGGNWNNKNSSSVFANVTGSVYLPGGPAAQKNQSAIVINIDPKDVGKLKALTPEGDIVLNKESTLVPVSTYRTNKITVDVADDSAQLYQIENSQHTVVSYPGNVKQVDIKANPIFTVTGRLVNKQGKPIAYQNVVNHLGASFTSDDGVFTLEVSTENPSLTWMSCEYDLSDKLRKAQPYVFLGDLPACDSLLERHNIRLANEAKPAQQNHEEKSQQLQPQINNMPNKVSGSNSKRQNAQPLTSQPALENDKGSTKPVANKALSKQAIQYASISPNLTHDGKRWLQNVLKKHPEELVLKRKSNGRIVLISECENRQDCEINPQILRSLNSSDAFKTSYIEGETLLEYNVNEVKDA